MERFTRFADAKTGSNPFLPQWSNYHKPQNSVARCSVKVLHLLTACARVILLVPSALLVVLLWYLSTPLKWFNLRALRRYIMSPAWSCLLAAAGLSQITEELAESRKLRVSPDADKQVCVGDHSVRKYFPFHDPILIASNFTSVVEVIYLEQKLQPKFMFPLRNGNGLLLCDFCEALSIAQQFDLLEFNSEALLTHFQ
eukprot:Lankesteria_metandrocarpae@DN5118_c1_g1_i2.p1